MASERTIEILKELLAREVAAKNLYEDLAERVKGTEFEHLHEAFADMAEEEREHSDRCRELLEKVRNGA